MRTFIIATLVCFGFKLSALPIGNPSDASLLHNGVVFNQWCDNPWDACLPWARCVSLRLGYYGDFVFNRHLRVDKSDNHSGIEKTKINTNAAFIAINVLNRIDLFGTLGNSNFYIRSFGPTFGALSNNYIEIKTETDFSYSIGLRASIWNCGCLFFGAEGQYFYTKPQINYAKVLLGEPTYLNGNDLRYEEWQIGFGLSYHINVDLCNLSIVPYFAVKWAGALVDMDDLFVTVGEYILFDLRNQRSWGYAVGLTLIQFDIWDFSLEGRFVDEKALYINSQFRF